MCSRKLMISLCMILWTTFHRYGGNTQPDSCFTQITLNDMDNHEITSPGYPVSLSNTSCSWQIDVKKYRENMTLNLVFEEVNMEDPDNCSSDFIKIVSNSSLVPAKTELAVLCGQQQTEYSFFIDSIIITYVTGSDQNKTTSGFKLVYRMQRESSCSETHSSNGWITSPGFPEPYPSFQRCTYLLETQGFNDIMRLRFSFVQLGQSCLHDYLLVYDGKGEDGHLIGRYCANDLYEFRGFHKNIFVVFVSSDNSIKNGGFRAEYSEEICGGDLDVRLHESKVIFPGHSYPFKDSIHCTWTLISGYELHRVLLTFTAVDVDCTGSRIDVYDGSRRVTPHWSFCDTSEQMILGTGSKMSVTFVRDIITGRSPFFIMHYRSQLIQECGAERVILTSYEYAQTLKSPEYPLRYPDYVDCVWEVHAASSENTIKLTVEEVDLHEGCLDILTFYNGVVQDTSNAPDKQLCGVSGTTFFDSKENSVTIHFRSDGVHAGKGFKLYYQSVSETVPTIPIPSTASNSHVIIVVVSVTVFILLIIILAIVFLVKRRKRTNSRSADHVYTRPRDPSIPSLVRMRSSILGVPPPSYQEASAASRTENGVQPSAPTDTSLPPTYSEAMLNNMVQVEWF